jgi:hypothetical protein
MGWVSADGELPNLPHLATTAVADTQFCEEHDHKKKKQKADDHKDNLP